MTSSAPLPRTAPARPASGFAAVAFTVLSWASAFPIIRLCLAEFAPLPLASLRFAIAGLLAAAYLLALRQSLPRPGDLMRLALGAGIGIAAYNGLLNQGQTSASPGAASFIGNTLPVFTAIIAFAALGERLTGWAWLGSLVSLGGVALIASGQPGGLRFGAGASLVLAAALCSAIYFTVQRPLIARLGAKPVTAWTLVLGALWLSPFLPEAARTAVGASPVTLAGVGFLGIVPAALGYLAWMHALGVFGAARAANFLYLVPPLALALSSVVTGEAPHAATLAGGALAICGVVLVNTLGRAR